MTERPNLPQDAPPMSSTAGTEAAYGRTGAATEGAYQRIGEEVNQRKGEDNYQHQHMKENAAAGAFLNSVIAQMNATTNALLQAFVNTTQQQQQLNHAFSTHMLNVNQQTIAHTNQHQENQRLGYDKLLNLQPGEAASQAQLAAIGAAVVKTASGQMLGGGGGGK